MRATQLGRSRRCQLGSPLGVVCSNLSISRKTDNTAGTSAQSRHLASFLFFPTWNMLPHFLHLTCQPHFLHYIKKLILFQLSQLLSQKFVLLIHFDLMVSDEQMLFFCYFVYSVFNLLGSITFFLLCKTLTFCQRNKFSLLRCYTLFFKVNWS